MDKRITAIYDKIKKLEDELEKEIYEAGKDFQYTIAKKKILFEKSVIAYHKTFRKTVFRFLREADFLNALTTPMIYSLIVPMVAMDITIAVYQFVCFPIYGIKKAPRGDFIAIDRHHLKYLNIIEKVNCSYCGYANGLAAWFREVSARTEEFWCPIKHARKLKNPHSKYSGFEDYGDAQGYRERMIRKGDK